MAGWNARATHPASAPHPSGAAGLIEVELGDGLGVGRIERGRLVEIVGGDGILCRGDGTGIKIEGGLGWIPGR